jgi:PAS domain S-box-containing protein
MYNLAVILTSESLKYNSVISKFNENNDIFFTAFHINPAMAGLISMRTGKYIDINKSVCDKLAYSREEIIGKKAYNINIVDKSERNKIIHLINSKKRINNYETTFKTKNGKMLHVLLSATILKGNEDYLYLVSLDITDFKKRELELRESEELYQSLFDTTFEAIIFLYQGRCFHQNKSAEKIFGYSLEEVIGRQISEWVVPEYRKTVLKNILSDNKNPYEVIAVRKNGSVFPAEIQIKKAFFKSKTIKIAVLRDISLRKKTENELKLAKEKAEAASKAKSEFLANVSHEIRTPMNAIIGFSEILLNKIDNPQNKRYLRSILASGKSLISLINNILDISKIEAGKIEIKKEPVSIKNIFKRIEKDFQQKIENRNLRFLIKISDNLPTTLLLDETRVYQILYNLLSNAIKFTKEGYILLQAKIVQKKAKNKLDLIFIVEDTGIGIPQKQRSLIFDTFIHKGRKYEGTGLGLSIAKRLTEKMNGEINLSSVVGKGSVFTVLLPNIETAKYQVNNKRNEPDIMISTDVYPVKIIIIDNNQHNINLLKDRIKSKNIEFVIIENTENLWEVLNFEMTNLIFLNIDILYEKEYQIIEKIKSISSLKKIKFIAYPISEPNKSFEENKHIFDGYIDTLINKERIYSFINNYIAIDELSVLKKEQEQIFTDVEKKIIAQFIRQHKFELLEQWKSINDSLIIYEIENFVYNVIKRSNKLNVLVLENYLNCLLTKTQEFDIEAIEQILSEFPEVLKKIENIK